MEVEEAYWIGKAVYNINRYLNRGGDLKGDDPQLLGGSDLLNTIGIAMGLPLRDPREWSQDELQQALSNELVYFEGDARKAIDVIADQIRYCCNGDDKILVTVLPVELYFDGKLYELPIFKVQRRNDSKKYYVDNIGRSYQDFNDWFNNNKLPPCQMAYPFELKLSLRQGCNYSRVAVDNTPSARIDAQIMEGVDIAFAVVGIGSGVALIFVTGGLAAPLVAAGAATAVWGTGRTGYQLIDRASHGESINPFTNSESRVLWLGIAANIVSFGAMGASMRLTSLAVRGRDISKSFIMLVNVMNGANVIVSGVAMVDTTIYLIEHYNELSSVDILMHVASMAFWTKGLFTYKTAETLINTAQEHAFKVISKELHPEEGNQLNVIRNQFNNDGKLLKEFHRASEANISIKTFSQIIIDSASVHGNVEFDGRGNLILTGGQKYSFELLSQLSQTHRRQYFDVITNLRPDQIELLESFRQKLNNDRNLISGLHKVAVYYRLNNREATEQVLDFWKKYTEMKLTPYTKNVSIKECNLLLGRAPPLQIEQLHGLSNSMIRFIGEHMVPMDESTSYQWIDSVPVLQQLESHGMFSKCKVTTVIPTGRAVLLLNENIQISIYKLKELDTTDCENLLKFIGELSPAVTSSEIPKNTRLLTEKYRLRLECHRRESVDWMKININERLMPILDSKLQNFEKERLFTFRSTVTTAKAMPYMREMMNFVADLNPRNVGEMVAYGEYVVTFVETEKRNFEAELRSGRLQLPANVKKTDFLRQKASKVVFNDPTEMRQQWETTVALVRNNSMVGPAALEAGLSDDALVTSVRSARIAFGSEASAAYHVLKHPTDPPSAYVHRANETIRSATRWQVTLSQDGDARLLRFEGPEGSAIVLERSGRVLLCTFSPKSAKG